MEITYHEIRTWARWLNSFTAEELADALGAVPLEVADRGVKALLWHGIVQDTGVVLEGRNGQDVGLYEYVPLPPGPTHHPHEIPPEVLVRLEMGGDPLRVVRGMPVSRSTRERVSRTGQWHPGRRGKQPV